MTTADIIEKLKGRCFSIDGNYQHVQKISKETCLTIEQIVQIVQEETRDKMYYRIIDVLTNGNYINGVDAVNIANEIRNPKSPKHEEGK